jgi:hypothetical protein
MMNFETWRSANPEAGALTIWQAAQREITTADPVTLSEDTVKQIEETARKAERELAKECITELLDYAQHDSWRCGYGGECHCGLNAITEKYGLPAVPLPEKGDAK